MFSRRRSYRPSHATVVAYLALFVAMGGTAYAAATIGSGQVIDNSLQSVDLKDNAGVRSQDVVNDTVTGGGLVGADVRPNSLTGADLNESQLGKVPQAGQADGAANAGTLDNLDSQDFFRSTVYMKQEGTPTDPGTDTETNPGLAGQRGQEIVTCEAGDIAISGGYQNPNQEPVTHSFRTNTSPQGWYVAWQNGASPDNVAASVVCVDQ